MDLGIHFQEPIDKWEAVRCTGKATGFDQSQMPLGPYPGDPVPFLTCPSYPAPLMVSSCAHAQLASLAWPGRGRGRQTPGPWLAAAPSM